MRETEFGLLGPLLVRSGGATVAVPPGKQRAVLAALLLSGGRAVSPDELAEVLWGADPPQSARVTVQNYVMRLRKVLGDIAPISTQPAGYVLGVPSGELDVTRFEDRLAAARSAARDRSWEAAASEASAALALWRGEPLADVESETLAMREVPRLAELRLQALELRIDADLQLGRQAEVITELRRLAAAQPLRERLHGLLMLALYRDGRQAEALAAYQQARNVLVDELGAEPGPALRELHRQILAGDPELLRARAGGRPPGSGTAVPRELPAPVPHFAGRGSELAMLSALLNGSGDAAAAAVLISAIGGTAGVGKTALAVQWAHQAADSFPDGQLYVNLRGYDPDRPVPAADALAGFLRSLGVPGPDIPTDEAERAGRYRSLLAGRRVLVVLDNAGSVEQVRPLLPGSASCAVVVTSRDSLAGLVARHGAARLDLDLLPPGDAIGLLDGLLGDRARAEPGAVATLADRCCRLPLALRVAAELTAARPGVLLADLAGELADEQRRLDALDAAGDPRTAVRAVFSWSYQHLDPGTARAFRLAGLHPGADFEPYAIAALIGSTLDEARRTLDTLARAHLIQPAPNGRYSMHDLLRGYARELAASHDGEDERRAALTRLFDYYLYAAATAMDAFYPAERHLRPRVAAPATVMPPLATGPAGRAWLDAERGTLVAATAHAASHGWPAHAVRLSATLYRYFMITGHYEEALVVYGHAQPAARQTGDSAAEGYALNQLAGIYWRLGRHQQSADCLEQAMPLFRQAGDRAGQARTMDNLSTLYTDRGRYVEAAALIENAHNIYREIGDRLMEGRTLFGLAQLDERLGRYDEGVDYATRAVAITREVGDRAQEGRAFGLLAKIRRRQGLFGQAIELADQSLAISLEIGDRLEECVSLLELGHVALRQGRTEEAAGYLGQSLDVASTGGLRDAEADALLGLGEFFLATGRPEEARASLTPALELTIECDLRHDQARAHDGLGRACRAFGDELQARRHWEQALAIYTELGVPEAAEVRGRLSSG